MRNFTPAQTFAALVVAASCFAGVTSCLEPNPAGDPNPLPYWVLEKKLFASGDWWVQRTVTQAPFNAGFTYIGDSDYSDRVHFKIEENFLIAYRSVDVIEGDDPDVFMDPDSVPALVWPILRQVDVVAGQQIEAPNTPWYDRTHVVVDWAHETSGTLRFSLAKVEQSGPSFWVMEPDDQDAPIFDDDYIDFTTHVVVAPSAEIDARTGRAACGPGGALDTAFVDAVNCSAMDIAYRTSLRRVPDVEDYEKLPSDSADMPPTWFDRFFRIARLHYDDQYGLTLLGKERLMSRFHLWQRSTDDNGAPLPLADRVVKPVVFHLNNDFPPDLVAEAQAAVDAWDDSFRDTVHDARAEECVRDGGAEDVCDEDAVVPDRVLVLCTHNPVVKGDDALCGRAGDVVRLGDLRHNMLFWVSQPSVNKPIGFAWWTPDLKTGETVAASAKIFGQGIDSSAAFARDAVLLATGRLQADDVASGRYLDPLAADLQAYANNPYLPRPEDADTVGAGEDDLDVDRPVVDTARPDRSLALYRDGALAPFVGSDLEALTIDGEALLMDGMSPATPLSQDVIDSASPLRTSFAARTTARSEFALRVAEIGGDLDLPIDPDLGALVDEFGEAGEDEIYQEVRRRFARTVITHELGHIFGLKHNFAASYDALNYPAEYWVNRRSDCTGPRYDCPLSDGERAAHLDDNAYASVMDYHPSANAYVDGLGHYDDAAIHALYGGLVEVFNDASLSAPNTPSRRLLTAMIGRDQIAHVPLVLEPDDDDPRGIHVTSVHYTRYPAVLGDLESRRYISARRLDGTVDDEGRFMVPYLTCADDLEGYMPYCLSYDHGADPFEVTSSLINWFKAYYPLNSFRRGRLGFEPRTYVRAMSSRVFHPLKRWNDWLIHTHVDYDVTDPEAYTNPDFLEPMQKASELSFNFFAQVLATPEPGDYLDSTLADGTPMLVRFKQPISHDEPGPAEDDVVMSLKFPQGRIYESVAVEDGGLIIANIGSAVDKELALEALLDPSFFDFPGRETWDQAELWTVNYYNEYPDALVDVLASIVAGDVARLAPGFDANTNGGEMKFRDYVDTSSVITGDPVDPAVGFNLRIRALLYGVSLLYSGYSDRSFLRYADIGVVGVDDIDEAAGVAVDFNDVATSTPYRAMSRLKDGVELGLGARLLKQAQVLQDRAQGVNGETDLEKSAASLALRRQIDLIEITRAVVAKQDAAGFGGPVR